MFQATTAQDYGEQQYHRLHETIIAYSPKGCDNPVVRFMQTLPVPKLPRRTTSYRISRPIDAAAEKQKQRSDH